MKKVIVILLVFTLSLTIGCSPITSSKLTESKSDYGFREIHWDMTKEQVRDSESRKPDDQNEYMLEYNNVPVAGFKATLIYNFDSENQVFSEEYLFAGNNHDSYQKNFNAIREELVKLYGNPNVDVKQTLVLSSVWNLENTDIALFYTYSINNEIIYVIFNSV